MYSKLHKLKNSAHSYFDILWLYKLHHSGKSPQYWRNKVYKWLAKRMNIKRKDCHFSLMDEDQLRQAINICSEEFANSDKLITFVDRIESERIPELQWFVQKYKRKY